MKHKSGKICKKILSAAACLMTATMFATMGAGEVSADTTAQLTASAAEGYAGDTVKVIVSLNDNPGIAGTAFELQYDASVLGLKGVVLDEDDEVANTIWAGPTINEEKEGVIGYANAKEKNITKSGTLFEVEFNILDGAAIGDSLITFTGRKGGEIEFVNADEENVEVTPVAGKVTVLCKHSDTEEKVTPATCTADGKKDVVCKKCQEVISTTTIPATGHTWGEAQVTKEPTCTEAGVSEKKCTKCDATENVEIPATGHVWGETQVTKEPTCTEAGVSEKKCTKCDATEKAEIPATGHVWGEIQVTKKPTCTEDGEGVQKCTKCDATENVAIPATGHTYDGYEVTKEATVDEAGEITLKCTVCGTTTTKEIPALKDVKVDVTSVDGSEFKLSYKVGNTVTFKAVGMGMSAAPAIGGVRFVPVSYKLNDKEEKVDQTSYEVSFKLDEAGDYKLVVVYAMEIFGKDGWKANGQITTVEKTLKVEAATEETTGETTGTTEETTGTTEETTGTTEETTGTTGSTGKNDVATGDTAGAAIPMLLFVCAVSSGAAVIYKKRMFR